MDEMVISIRQTLSVAREVFPVTSYPLIQGGKLSGEVAGRARCLYFLMKSNLFVRVGKQKKYISNNVLNYFIGDIYLFTTLYRVISAFTMPVL